MSSYDEYRFGDFLQEINLEHHVVSYNELTPKATKTADGKLKISKTKKLNLRPQDLYRILAPYTGVRFLDQVKAVVPLAVYLVLFQILVLQQMIQDSWLIVGGLFGVLVGLMFFMEGLKLGLMPFGESIGNTLPRKSPLPAVLMVAFILGVMVTYAEPAIGALKTAGSIVDVKRAPYLFYILNHKTDLLVLFVGMGVGLAAVLGTLRFIYNWSLKPLIYAALIPTLALTAYLMSSPELSKVLGLAWDCGAVTTGPVTVPLVLALGIGVASATGNGENSLSGFGIVTLASLFPIIGVMILATFVALQISSAEIMALAQSVNSTTLLSEPTWYELTPGTEIKSGFQSILPLVIFLLIVMKFMLKEKIKDSGIITYGISLAVVGMIVFNLGLTFGLSKLGGQSGSLVPAAFTPISGVENSPLYNYAIGIFLAGAFAWFLGFGATLAEPALNALGMTVENLTNGAFKKSLLMYSVSIGVACGIAIGVFKIIYNIPLGYILLPGYLLAIALTYFSSEEFVNVAWDSAGVTTGPVTVPLVLAMGLGFGNAVGALDGFGILSMASICPILSVMICGLYVRQKRNYQIEESEAAA